MIRPFLCNYTSSCWRAYTSIKIIMSVDCAINIIFTCFHFVWRHMHRGSLCIKVSDYSKNVHSSVCRV